MKRRGTSTEPWGTPWERVTVAELQLFMLLSVQEIGFKPGEGSASHVEGSFQMGEKNSMVNGVESCTEVEEDKDV